MNAITDNAAFRESFRTLIAETARMLFSYDGETGKLFHNRRPLSMFNHVRDHNSWNSRVGGKEAGHARPDGYLKINLGKKQYFVHRIIWLMATGEWPKDQLDHINGIRADNRLSNLREVTNSENRKNICRYRTNKSGVTGVRFHKTQQIWVASIATDSKRVWLGRFASKDEAIAARTAAEIEFNFHPNHGRAA